MSWKDVLRKSTPQFLLDWNRRRKKRKRNAVLAEQKKNLKGISTADIIADLQRIGIEKGDTVLVHSSLSRIGYLEKGAKTFVDALKQQLGEEGTILMPTSPNPVYQLDYIQQMSHFDVLHSPSKTGKITEYFRKLPDTSRSLHPTEPVSAWGKNADYFVKDHFNQLTPYNQDSPFYRISEARGKILYVGVTLSMAGTNLHTLEDAVDFKFPVYHPDIFECKVVDEKGVAHTVKTKVHDPTWSKKRKCDELIPMFIEQKVMKREQIGEAETLVVDAKGFFEVMLDQYQKHGVTMYTPHGS
ncbi:MAG: AAC(3) family N-acetyltransferase [Crocinitomicaceae bacterium]